MTLKLNPPPLQVPPEFLKDKISQAFFQQLLNTIYQIWNSLYGLRFTAKVTTTDNTLTSIARVKVPTGKTVMVVADIVARRTGGTAGADGDSAWYTLSGAYKNIAGVLTGIGSPDLIGGEDQAGWNVGFSSSTSEIVVTVLGATSNDVTWEASVESFIVGA